MAYEKMCMYCFEDMQGQSTCPHCGRDSRAAVPQIQMLPGSMVYHDRFLIGRALGQDASGIVYAAYDTKKENRLRIREYLPRDCAERLNDGAVVPIAGMEDQFEAGIRKLRASVEGVEDPRKRHFFFEENGTAYIAQRKSASSVASREEEPDEDEETGGSKRVLMFAAIAVVVLVVAAMLLITIFNGAVTTNRDITQSPTLDPNQVWIPLTTPTATPYVAPTFAALVDPELSWMDYTYDGDVEEEYQQARRASATATPKPTAKPDGSRRYTLINGDSDRAEIRELQQKLSEEGWLDSSQINGKYDSATRQAVRELQSYVNEHYNPRQKLTVDGVAGPKTLQWLYEADIQKPTPTPKPKVTPKPDENTVDKDSSSSQVRRVQQKLITLGLLPASAADGKYGATTAEAVRKFQRRVNQLAGYDVLDVTGTMDAQSLAFLDYYAEEWENLRRATAKPTATPKATPKPTATPTTRPLEIIDGVIDGNATKEQIRKVQQLLVDIGMLPRKGVDGIYGSATISAVADFQQWVNAQRKEQILTVNGEVDQLTLLYLQYCKDHGFKPYATTEPKATEKPTAKPTAEPLPLVEDDESEEPEEDEGSQEISIDENSPEESIQYIQEMLAAVGAMSADGIDGIYGGGTVRAVERFQRWVNSVQGEGTLPVNGKVDNRTRLALEYAYDHELTISDAADEPTPSPTETPTPLPTEEPKTLPTQAPTDQPLVREEDEPEEPEVPEGSQPISVDESSDTESIRFVQQMLHSAGLLSKGDINGVYDRTTTEAVKRFQAWVNSVRGKDVLPVSGKIDDLTRQALEYAYDHEMSIDQQPDGTGDQPGEDPGELEEPEEPEETEAPKVGEVSQVEIAFGEDLAGGDVVSVSGKKVKVQWRAEGDVESYYIRVEDSSGNGIVNKEATKDTSFNLETRKMTPGEVYSLRVGAMPAGGTEDDILWKTARFMLPGESPDEGEPEPEDVEEPVDPEEPTIPEELEIESEDSEPEPEEQDFVLEEQNFEIEAKTENAVGVVSAPDITVAGVNAGSSTIVIEDDAFSISWKADGDVDSYYIRIIDSNGKDMTEPQYTTQTVVKLRAVNMDEGEVYTMSVGAVPVNGTREDMVVSRARFMRPVRETPVPTEVPTPAPQVATIGKPAVNVGGSAYQQDGISYMTGGSIIISWSADGEVENYTVYVENQSGEKQELGSTTDTSRTVSTGSLPAGIYTVYVGAMPRGGGGDDIVWGSTRFGIPAEEEPEDEEPPEQILEDEDSGEPEDAEDDEPTEEYDEPVEGYDEPVEEDDEPAENDDSSEAMSIRGPISGSSDADTVKQLQLRLYSMGLLSPDAQEGVLDAQTLQAVAEFQTRMNEQQDAGFDVVDPGDLSSVVDAATVSAIFSS